MSYRTCPSCSRTQPLTDFRSPGSNRGAVPAACLACRVERFGEAWCRGHEKWHAMGEFAPSPDGTTGVKRSCRDFLARERASRYARPTKWCPSCSRDRSVVDFAGSGSMSHACRDCCELHASDRWCTGCTVWLPQARFYRLNNGYIDSCCALCRRASRHNTTVVAVLAVQGGSRPHCAVCGVNDDLQVHHDHKCCPTSYSCGECVRGFLCGACNRAESHLRTADRAYLLAAFMANQEASRRARADRRQAIWEARRAVAAEGSPI